MRISAWLETGLAAAERVFLVVANGLLIGMLGINLVNILSRLLFDVGIIWVFPWTSVMFVWMVFFGFFVVYRRGKDITVDFVVKRLSAGWQRAIQRLVDVIILGLLATILLQAPTLLPRQVGELDLVGLQRYWLAVPFYLSCALIALQFVKDLMAGPAADGAPTTASPGSGST